MKTETTSSSERLALGEVRCKECGQVFDLMQVPIKDFHLRAVPKTYALADWMNALVRCPHCGVHQ